jgi:hypothetical protein
MIEEVATRDWCGYWQRYEARRQEKERQKLAREKYDADRKLEYRAQQEQYQQKVRDFEG